MTAAPRPSPTPRPQPQSQPQSQRVGRTAGIGWLGVTAVVAGAVLLAVAFYSLDWFSVTGGLDFHAIDPARDANGATPALIAKLYFDWLAWTLAIVGVVLSLVACVPSPAGLALRVFGAVAGFAGVALTLLSIRLYTTPSAATYSFFLERVESGFYVAAAGFLLVGIGAMVGPLRLRPIGDAARVGRGSDRG